MAIDVLKIIGLIEEAIKIKEEIEKEIRKENDARKRKALRKAFKNLDSAILYKLWFK